MSGKRKRAYGLAGSGLLFSVTAVAITCNRPSSSDTASVSSALVDPSVTERGIEWSVFYPNQSFQLAANGQEVVAAAIGPQSTPSACANGAMVATFGGAGDPPWNTSGTGAQQNLAYAPLPNLSTGSVTAAQIPEPQPEKYQSKSACTTYDVKRSDDVRSSDVRYFTDAEVARVGQTSFLHLSGAGNPQNYGSCQSNFTLDASANIIGPPLPPYDGHGFYTALYRTSSDCGAHWPGTPGTDGSMPYSTLEWIDDAPSPYNHIDWNFDMAHIYVDPFHAPGAVANEVYIHGVVATIARGVWASTDGGQTFTNGSPRRYIGAPWVAGDPATEGGSMTSTSDGTLFYAGCYNTDVRLYTSQNQWQSHTAQVVNTGGMPPCGWLDPWPVNSGYHHGHYAVSVSRIAFSSMSPNLARVRVAYPTVLTVGGAQRQGYVVLVASVLRIGATGTVPAPAQIAVLGGTSNNSILEAGFAEPDPFDTPRNGHSSTTTDLPDTAVLWSLETDETGPSLQARYRVWQGGGQFTAPYDLSPVNWSYGSTVWSGDYNKSTYYYDPVAQRNNYLLVWPQGENGFPTPSTTVSPHYNIVTVRPVPDATTVHVEELNFGTLSSGPAVSSQGFKSLDVFWVDPTGKLTEKSYSNGWISGTSQLPAPPASANGFQGDPAAVSWGPGRNDVVIRGNDNKIYQVWRQNGGWTWTPWPLMPDTVTSSPAIVSMGTNKLHIFARFPDNTIRYFRFTSAGWDTSWTSLGGGANSDPVAVADSNSIHVFVRGGGNCTYQRYSSDGVNWLPVGAWESDCEGLAATTAPAIAEWYPGRYDIFAGNTDASNGNATTLMHVSYENGWQAEWNDFQTDRNGINMASNPDAVSWGAQRFDVFAKASDGLLWHVWYDQP